MRVAPPEAAAGPDRGSLDLAAFEAALPEPAPPPPPAPERLFSRPFASPIDDLELAWDEQGRLRLLQFAGGRTSGAAALARAYPGVAIEPGDIPAGIGEPLADYFDGALDALAKIPRALNGTAFQRTVWRALETIPAGTTQSYGGLARRIGLPNAMRAVGLANGQNPVAVVVPCHRVIGADGSLTGFGGGLPRKIWLLEHEGAAFGRPQPSLI
jgi:methylated-DNA-[protein]-cysteine S-methyltransferase